MIEGFLTVVVTYVSFIFILCFVMAAYLLAGLKTAKTCIKVFVVLQTLLTCLFAIIDMKMAAIVLLSSIPFYIFMFILWKFCKKNGQDNPNRLPQSQRNTLDKVMYDYFVKGNRENKSTTIDHDELNVISNTKDIGKTNKDTKLENKEGQKPLGMSPIR